MTIDDVKTLYFEEGLSTREIGKRLGKSVWQVISFMRKHKLERRSPAETQRLQFSRKPLSFNKKENFSQKDRELWIAGLSLYWAEGVKFNGNHVVDLANSDQKMIMIFLKMLRVIYRVDEKRIRILLYCYGNQDVQKLLAYWSQKLCIPRSQFIKPYIRYDYDIQKINKMPLGLVHVRYNDKRLFLKIRAEIDIIVTTLL